MSQFIGLGHSLRIQSFLINFRHSQEDALQLPY